MDYYKLAEDRLKQSCLFIELEDRDKWLNLRKEGIGGSDVAGIFNESPFTDKRQVYLSKMDDYVPEQLNNSAIDFGNAMEDLIFKMFEVKYGKKYACLNFKDIMFRNYFTEFLQASLDGVLVDRETLEIGVLEIKTVQASAISKWYDSYGNPITPIYYLYQVLHYLNTTKLDFAVVYALANVESGDIDMSFRKPRIYYKNDLLEEIKIIEKGCVSFWYDNVKAKKEPGIKL
jgi:putative phage-type endonuclease